MIPGDTVRCECGYIHTMNDLSIKVLFRNQAEFDYFQPYTAAWLEGAKETFGGMIRNTTANDVVTYFRRRLIEAGAVDAAISIKTTDSIETLRVDVVVSIDNVTLGKVFTCGLCERMFDDPNDYCCPQCRTLHNYRIMNPDYRDYVYVPEKSVPRV